MSNPFTEVMSRRSDTELIGIVGTYRGDYEPAAIAAAELELQQRNIPIDVANLATQEIELEHNEKLKRANMPLETPLKVVTFLLPGFLNILIAGVWKANGYSRKFADAGRWTMYGFLFYFILVILIVLLGS